MVIYISVKFSANWLQIVDAKRVNKVKYSNFF